MDDYDIAELNRCLDSLERNLRDLNASRPHYFFSQIIEATIPAARAAGTAITTYTEWHLVQHALSLSVMTKIAMALHLLDLPLDINATRAAIREEHEATQEHLFMASANMVPHHSEIADARSAERYFAYSEAGGSVLRGLRPEIAKSLKDVAEDGHG